MVWTREVPQGPLREIVNRTWEAYRLTWYSPRRADPPSLVALYLPDGVTPNWKAAKKALADIKAMDEPEQNLAVRDQLGYAHLDVATRDSSLNKYIFESLTRALNAVSKAIPDGEMDRLMTIPADGGTVFMTCDLGKFRSPAMDKLSDVAGSDILWRTAGFTDACRCHWPL